MPGSTSRLFLLTIVGTTAAGCATNIPVSEGNAPLLEAIAAVTPSFAQPPAAPPPVVASPYLTSANVSPSGLAAVPAFANNGTNASPSPPAPSAPGAGAPAAGNDPAALQRIMAELESLGTVDPATQRQLLADLQQTDPALWPLMMQTFRAGMTYRGRQAAPPSAPFATVSATAPPEKSATEPVVTSPLPIPPKVSTVGASATVPPSVLPAIDVLSATTNPRSGASPGLSFPASTLLSAALNEAQRREAAATEPAPPSDSKSSAVKPASNDEHLPDLREGANDVDWPAALERAIAALERQTREPPHSAHEVTRHAWLRILYLAAGRREDALKPIAGIAAVEQDFWSAQLYALATYLDTQKLSDPARRSAETARHLAKATARLSEASTLTVKNLAFCTEVSSFGVYQKFKADEFKANQPLLLYAEVENYKSDETAKGFHTALRSSYQILDAQGRRVAENDLALTEEYCQNLRRDYFLRYFLSVPERIYAGKYVLQLTIVDTLSQKIGQSSIEFTVVDK